MQRTLRLKEPEHSDDTPLRAVEDAVDERDDDADFTDQPLTTDAQAVVEDGDGSEVFFASTDPVLRPGAHGEPEIAARSRRPPRRRPRSGHPTGA